MKIGIVSYGSYLPAFRLSRKELGVAHGASPKGPDRVVASFDEDSTTLAVEAGRAALQLAPVVPNSLYFASTTPVYADKTNAVAAHAALGLPRDALASDLGASARSSITSLRMAAMTGGMALMSDVRVGRPASSDEANGADGAAAFMFAGPGQQDDIIAELLAQESLTEEFLDRWRDPGQANGVQWEERFGLSKYAPLIQEVGRRSLDTAGLEAADHVVLVSPNTAINKQATKFFPGRISTSGLVAGHAGAADAGLALAKLLDEIEPDRTILLLSASDGADALVFRTTHLVTDRRQPVPVSVALNSGREIPYPKYLGWRGILDPEGPRRPMPDRPAAPPSSRALAWKFSFQGSTCARCGFVHLPPTQVCKKCGAVNEMNAARLSSGPGRGTVATFTVDRLAFSPSPPVVNAVVDFDDGGRYTLEIADADPEQVVVGARVELVFRTLFTAGGVSDYFWKARVLTTQSGQYEANKEEAK